MAAETPTKETMKYPQQIDLSEGNGSQFNSSVCPTAEMSPDMEDFRAKMGIFNMRLRTSGKVDNTFCRW